MNEEELFERALEVPIEERAALLDRLCPDEPELLERVKKLLAAHDSDSATLATVAPPNPGPIADLQKQGDSSIATVASSSDPRIGILLSGKYKLTQVIGEGGMGTVYLASQTEPVKRLVAVKVVKAGMDCKAVMARFESERQALAMMEHPNIAKVLDAGTTDNGHPYFVMELVKGKPITQFCDEHKFTPRERLELFLPVCEAIQHSHQKGIIHRDIKPSNVLVAMYDDRPVPKVIDFGVAKATGPSLTNMTLVTGFGALVGTPEYMSPEQAGLNNMDIDTRSDVYSLGVLLYELLSGHTPVDRKSLEKAAIYEILRIVRDVDAPRLSAKLSSIATLPSVAANRRTEPRILTSIFRGELDWVLQKALEKDRTRRYATANGLARDIQRYLADEIVEARPPSTSYRLRKFVRHHRGQVLAVGLVFLALVAGIAGTSWGLIRAEERRVEAEKAREDEATQRGIAQANEAEALRAKDEETRQRALAEAARLRAVEFQNKALNALRATTGEDVEKLIGEKTTLTENERNYLEAIAKRWQAFAIEEGNDPQSRTISGEGHFRVASLWDKLGKVEEALQEYEKTEAVYSKLTEEFPADVGYRSFLAGVYNNFGLGLRDVGKGVDAKTKILKALEIGKKLAIESPDEASHLDSLSKSHNSLGLLLMAEGNSTEAVENFRQSVLLMEKLTTKFPNEAYHREELASGHSNFGQMLGQLGKIEAAQEQCQKGIAIRENLVADFPNEVKYLKDLSASHNNFANVLSSLGNKTAAIEQHRKGLFILKKLATDYPSFPRYSESLALCQTNLGIELVRARKLTEAELQYRDALSIRENLVKTYPTIVEYRQDLAVTHKSLGSLLSKKNKNKEALEQYRLGLNIRKKLVADFGNVPQYQRDLASSLHSLGNFLRDFKDGPKRSEPFYREALAIFESLISSFPENPNYRRDISKIHEELGDALLEMKRNDEAESEYQLAITFRERLVNEFPNVPDHQSLLCKGYLVLAEMMLDTDNAAISLVWFEKALESLRKIQAFESQLTAYKGYLRRIYKGRGIAYDILHMEAKADADWQMLKEFSPEKDHHDISASRALELVHASQVSKALGIVDDLAKLPAEGASLWKKMACIYSVASRISEDQQQVYSDRAMELVNEAVKQGYDDYKRLEKDIDLDPIRDREDFKKLVAEVKEKKMSAEQNASETNPPPLESPD